MAQSKHKNWMRKVDGKHRLFRPLTNDYDVIEYEQYSYTEGHIEAVSKLIQDNLSKDLLSDDFIKDYPPKHSLWKRPYVGYCVPATFALLYLMDTDKLQPMQGDVFIDDYVNVYDEGDWTWHWWLEDKKTKQKYDPTHQQFLTEDELQEVYKTGRPMGYYGYYDQPASRFLKLMTKVQPTAVRWTTEDKEESTPGTLHNFL